MEDKIIAFFFQYGFPTALVSAVLMFVGFRVWPWLTGVYWPVRQKVEAEREARDVARDDRRDANSERLLNSNMQVSETLQQVVNKLSVLPEAIGLAAAAAMKDHTQGIVTTSEAVILERIGALSKTLHLMFESGKKDGAETQDRFIRDLREIQNLLTRIERITVTPERLEQVFNLEHKALKNDLFAFMGGLLRPASIPSIPQDTTSGPREEPKQ